MRTSSTKGSFYLDWLLDHRAEFTLLAMKHVGVEVEDKIDWSSPRLICIAGDFTKYDEHAVAQINRSIELMRYRNYGEEFIVLELVNSVVGTPIVDSAVAPKSKTKTVTEYLDQSPDDLKDLYQALEDFLAALGDDVTKKITQVYIAFRRIKNFASVEVHPQSRKLLVYLKVDPDSIELDAGFTRDVRNIGHFGTGDLEVTLTSLDDFERAKRLLVSCYESS